jgi:hypothetical protein
LAGGVILAAIEGLNILIVRVLVPSFEKQQMEAQGIAPPKVDPLEPPRDPNRPRSSVPKKPLWESNPAPSPLFQSSAPSSPSFGGGSQWDTPGFRTESFGSSDRSLAENTEEKKPFWKLW